MSLSTECAAELLSFRYRSNNFLFVPFYVRFHVNDVYVFRSDAIFSLALMFCSCSKQWFLRLLLRLLNFILSRMPFACCEVKDTETEKWLKRRYIG